MAIFFYRSLPVTVLLGLAGCSAPALPETVRIPAEEIGDYFAREAGVRPVAARDFSLHDGGTAIRAEMLRLVAGARDYVLIDSFLVTEGPGDYARAVLDALIERHRAGVRVQVIGDASSRWVSELSAFEYLAKAGVPVAEFHPIGVPQLLRWGEIIERDHRKFWIVDGRVVFLGGANLNDRSLAPAEKGGNLDLMVRFTSPGAVRKLVESYVRTWNDARPDDPLNPADFPVRDEDLGQAGDLLWVFNQDLSEDETQSPTGVMMGGLLGSATREVWLIQPYSFTNPHIVHECRALVERGVEVHIVLSTAARAPRFRYASHFGIESLLDAGVRVWIYESPVNPLHYKCVLVDDRIASVGSANLNLRSYRLSRELSVVFDDPGATGDLRNLIGNIRKGSRLVTQEEARRYRGPKYLAWWVLMQGAG